MKMHRTPMSLQDGLKIYCHLLREKGHSYHQIGKLIGKKHCTAIYHLKKFDDYNAYDKEFRQKVKEFNEEEFRSEYQKEIDAKQAFVEMYQQNRIQKKKDYKH
ncbi:hypothetical protein [Chryseobacterium vrystaatense]|uniref:Uncharacterized protein n=1 Tax=Chryseobacterium vrystaatense TaxID=307480 RepID=A0A1M4ZI18_9FLAO|nr:hypothetical protein [Chryseobacterium vrystaatense]SHF17226.1 hypothetical protein SAMN02787073_1593 [Chryseobacterium vrystaatense]